MNCGYLIIQLATISLNVSVSHTSLETDQSGQRVVDGRCFVKVFMQTFKVVLE